MIAKSNGYKLKNKVKITHYQRKNAGKFAINPNLKVK